MNRVTTPAKHSPRFKQLGALLSPGRHASAGHPAALAAQSPMTAAAPPAARKVAKSPSPARPLITATDLSNAAAQALTGECQRWKSVFASEHSKGRERICARLLGHSSRMTAQKIISELATLPTDEQLEQKERTQGQAKITATWEKAHNEIAMRMGTQKPSPADPKENHGWAKIHEDIRQARGA